MSNRESSDGSSSSGVSYPAGSSSSASTVKGVKISLDYARSVTSKLGSSGAFNGHAVIVHADGAVWDSVSNVYLYPGKDFNPGDLQRT